MKNLLCGFAAALILGSAPIVWADPPLFEVCVDPATAVFSNGFLAGSVLTAAGIIVPAGTIPDGGAEDCSDVAGARIGTFFVRGNIVLGLLAAAADDLAYVSWQFNVDDQGMVETTGPVKTTSPYFQTIAGANGDFKGLRNRNRRLRTDVLDAGGFQIRLTPVN